MVDVLLICVCVCVGTALLVSFANGVGQAIQVAAADSADLIQSITTNDATSANLRG